MEVQGLAATPRRWPEGAEHAGAGRGRRGAVTPDVIMYEGWSRPKEASIEGEEATFPRGGRCERRQAAHFTPTEGGAGEALPHGGEGAGGAGEGAGVAPTARE